MNSLIRQNLDRGAFFLTSRLHRVLPQVPVLTSWPTPGRIASGVYWRVIHPAKLWILPRLARLHRARVRNVTFVAITGSAGKTTAKDMIAAMLETRGRCHKNPGSLNQIYYTTQEVMKVKKSHDFCVIELSADKPGYLETQLQYVQPNIGVVTTVGIDQYKAFRTLDNVAREKGKLIQSLPTNGFAVLNADDPLVMGMADGYAGTIVTYGTSDAASLRASQVRSNWPERLCFTVEHQGKQYPVVTKLCGVHFLPSILAAIATGIALDIPLEHAIAAIESVEPFDGRMSPVELNSGITFIRDDWKAPLWSLSAPLDFMKNASAQRKIVVLGTVSDYPGAASRTYRRVSESVMDAADVGVFVGPHSTRALRSRDHSPDKSLFAFGSVSLAHAFLADFLRPGDLVLLKGSNTADHLARLALVHTTEVHCWLMDCGKSAFCNQCALIAVPSVVSGGEVPDGVDVAEHPATSRANTDIMVFVGFGNPGEQFRDTPHNVGQRMVDRFADSLGKAWVQDQDALYVETSCQGQDIILVKPIASVNESGSIVKRFFLRQDLKPEQCILVYDDFDMAFGKVRIRSRGSDGGHRGVRSVLTAFQTDDIRRIKIGMQKQARPGESGGIVIAPFTTNERGEVDRVCDFAIERAKEAILRNVNS